MAAPNGFTIGATAAARRLEMNVGRAERHEAEMRRRDYAAAQYSRLTQDFITTLLSADQSLKSDLRRLRGASRSLVRDNSFATRFGNMLAENVIGHQGIQLQALIGNTRGGMNKKASEQLEDAWLEWGFPENASADGRLSWVQLQELAMMTVAPDGEYCYRILRGYPNAFNFALEPLDVDLLDESYIGTSKSNEVRMGVEVNAWNKPVAYWMWTRHPSDMSGERKRERVRIDAADIIHEFATLRPGQTRGVPWFTPVLIDQKMLQAYQEAEVTAARWGASNMAAVMYDAEKAGGSMGSAAPGAGAIPMEVEPGRLLRLGPGETLGSTDFNHPNTAFPAFSKAIQRSIATGLNVAYTSMSGDLEAVNYSSIRAGLIGERDFYRRMQAWTASRLCRRVFREWVLMAALSGKIPGAAVASALAPGATKWRPRGWQWVDPRNDIEAAHLEIGLGVNSRTNVMGERGRDYEEIIESLKHEQEIADAAGVSISPIGVTVKGQAPNDDPGGDNNIGTPAAPAAASTPSKGAK